MKENETTGEKRKKTRKMERNEKEGDKEEGVVRNGNQSYNDFRYVLARPSPHNPMNRCAQVNIKRLSI